MVVFRAPAGCCSAGFVDGCRYGSWPAEDRCSSCRSLIGLVSVLVLVLQGSGETSVSEELVSLIIKKLVVLIGTSAP